MAQVNVKEDSDSYSDLEAEYEIVEHEQAHAVAMARSSRPREQSMLEEQEEESRWGQQATATDQESTWNLSELFLDSFAGMMNHDNLQSILKEQSHMLSTMEISNEKLASLNNISEMNYQAMSLEFRQHTQTLLAMKRQLDSCFRRIRSLKSKLALQYPEAYEAAVSRCQSELDSDDAG